MAKYIADGVLQLHYVAAIEDQDNPTLGEITGGVDLTPFLRALNTPLDGSTVDSATPDTTYNTTVAGTHGGQPVTADFTRDTEYDDDTAWTTLPRTTTGFWVVARRGGTGTAGALQVADRVDVWPITVVTRNPGAYSRNSLEMFTVECSVNPAPSEDVEIDAAS